MDFCEKCGTPLRVDGKCPKCDMPVPVKDNKTVSDMSVEESIKLAEKLSEGYEDLKTIKSEMDACEAEIRSKREYKERVRYSAFRFFWPFLIIAAVAYVFVVLAFSMIALSSGNTEFPSFAYLIAFIVAGIILLVGGSRARNKRDSLNVSVINLERERQKRLRDLEVKYSKLKQVREEVRKMVCEYDYIVPASMRNKLTMDLVKDFLSTGRAQTFTDALELCGTKGNDIGF